jgi:predicted RNA-binding protein YlxR (DUF448 family)
LIIAADELDEDGSPEAAGKVRAGSLRTCIVSREQFAPEALIRFVADPAGRIVPDLKRSLPGRGVWVRCSREAVAEAVRTKAFARAMRRPVEVDPGLAELVGALLRRRALEALSIANKAGAVTLGFAKIERALERGEVCALVHARDGAADGKGKLDRQFRAVSGGQPVPVLDNVFTVAELSLALGRPNVVHAALNASGASNSFLAASGRLWRYEGLALPIGAVTRPADRINTEDE